MRINGHLLPSPSQQWAPFFEEFFFHTSRYYAARLHELQQMAEEDDARLEDFHASELTDTQRFVLSWMMTSELDKTHARNVLHVLNRFHQLDKKKL